MAADLKPLSLSVTMTVYNAGAFLAEAIDSILGQTYSDFEFLILDDASTDNTAEIIFRKQAGDPRIRYFKNEVNSGLAKTKNKIIDLCSGTIIAIVDGDDVNVPTRFEKQMALFAARPDIHVVSSDMYVVNNKGRVCDVWHYPTDDAEIKKGLHTATMIAHPASMFRREVFDRLGGYNEQLSISEDWDFFYRASLHFNLANIPEPLVYYRFHESNTSVVKLPYTVLYAVYFKNRLPLSVFTLTLPQFAAQYPQYKADVCTMINRFYSFSMDTFLRLDYGRLSLNLYKQVKQEFFVFFDRHDKRLFIKNAIAVYLKRRSFGKILLFLKDYLYPD